MFEKFVKIIKTVCNIEYIMSWTRNNNSCYHNQGLKYLINFKVRWLIYIIIFIHFVTNLPLSLRIYKAFVFDKRIAENKRMHFSKYRKTKGNQGHVYKIAFENRNQEDIFFKNLNANFKLEISTFGKYFQTCLASKLCYNMLQYKI